jgi:hypothetical protein
VLFAAGTHFPHPELVEGRRTLVQALYDAVPNVGAHWMEHHSASFDTLRMGDIVLRMRDIGAATGVLVAATTFLILSLSKDAA